MPDRGPAGPAWRGCVSVMAATVLLVEDERKLRDLVRSYLERAGLIKHLGEDHIFWSSYEAIMAADHYRAQQANKVPVTAGEMTTA